MRFYPGRFLNACAILTHPSLVITNLLILPIVPGRGDKFYFNFIYEGLIGLKLYALTTVVGISLMIYSTIKFKRPYKIEPGMTCKGAWLNMAGLILIGFSLASFYSLHSTPYFRDSTSTTISLLTFIHFFLLCHVFNGYHIAFIIVSVQEKHMDKSEYYDDDEIYGSPDDDEYIEI